MPLGAGGLRFLVSCILGAGCSIPSSVAGSTSRRLSQALLRRATHPPAHRRAPVVHRRENEYLPAIAWPMNSRSPQLVSRVPLRVAQPVAPAVRRRLGRSTGHPTVDPCRVRNDSCSRSIRSEAVHRAARNRARSSLMFFVLRFQSLLPDRPRRAAARARRPPRHSSRHRRQDTGL